jgi:hypothetical protein
MAGSVGIMAAASFISRYNQSFIAQLKKNTLLLPMKDISNLYRVMLRKLLWLDDHDHALTLTTLMSIFFHFFSRH